MTEKEPTKLELQARLRIKGLPTSGKKADLVARLASAETAPSVYTAAVKVLPVPDRPVGHSVRSLRCDAVEKALDRLVSCRVLLYESHRRVCPSQ